MGNSSSSDEVGGGFTSLTMNNYWSIGVDAKVALDFHRRREEKPHLFMNRTVNKGWYGLYGMKEMKGSYGPIHRHMKLYLDGEETPIPENMEGIIILNIASYAGGCDLWGKKSNVVPPSGTWRKASMSDGYLEVIDKII